MVQVKGSLGTATTLTMTLTALGDGAGRVATQHDGGANFPIKGWISVLVKTGDSAPVDGSLLELYMAFSDNEGTENVTDSIPTSDAALTSKPDNAKPIGSIVMKAITNYDHRVVIPVFDLPRKWSLVMWNAAGAALSTSASHHVVKFVPQFDETV